MLVLGRKKGRHFAHMALNMKVTQPACYGLGDQHFGWRACHGKLEDGITFVIIKVWS